jgi:hypothetical protein
MSTQVGNQIMDFDLTKEGRSVMRNIVKSNGVKSAPKIFEQGIADGRFAKYIVMKQDTKDAAKGRSQQSDNSGKYPTADSGGEKQGASSGNRNEDGEEEEAKTSNEEPQKQKKVSFNFSV